MREISRFFGIVIGMYYQEHGLPHFHARTGSLMISVEVDSQIVRGEFPGRALRQVLDWSELHRGRIARELGTGSAPSAAAPDSASGINHGLRRHRSSVRSRLRCVAPMPRRSRRRGGSAACSDGTACERRLRPCGAARCAKHARGLDEAHGLALRQAQGVPSLVEGRAARLRRANPDGQRPTRACTPDLKVRGSI
jgi:hypothetical protein